MKRARDYIQTLVDLFPASLNKLGIVDQQKGKAAFDLAIPVMVTGGLRTLLRTADFFMISLALGPAAVAGLQFGFQYFFIAFGLSLAVSSGTISVVSRFQGGGEHHQANIAVKQSLWLALAISVPLVIGAWTYATSLIDLLTDDERVITLGAIYLQIIMLSAPFRFWSMVGARALSGAGDTRTPMYVRAITLPTNLALNAILIFGPGPAPQLGIAGAAIGTATANVLAAAVFFVLLILGRSGIKLPLRGPHVDVTIIKEILRVGVPLSGTRLIQSGARFPFLFVLGTLGTSVVAAYAIGRRLMQLAMMPAWGFSTASSTLVGQALGKGDETEAEDYGWQTVRLALATQLPIAVVLFIGARPLTRFFGADNVELTVHFVQVFGVAVAGFCIGRTLRGALRGAGDTTFPFYGAVIGNFVVRLPVATLALPPGMAFSISGASLSPGWGFGVSAVFAAICGDLYIRAIINWSRFKSDRWKAIARAGLSSTSTEKDQ